MQKIPTVFIRDKQNPKLVTCEVDPDCKWVIDGEGIATEKYDGSACLILHGQLFRRHRVKEGKALPPGWIHWSLDPNQLSGHGWAIVGDSTADQYHREAWGLLEWLEGQTYELVGPSLQKNPYELPRHELWRHGLHEFHIGWQAPRTFQWVHDWLRDTLIEGIVWHHPDGRMAKIKRRDFGFRWPVKDERQ